MSSPYDDPIPLPRVQAGNLVEALSAADDLPVEALERAAAAPDRIAEAVLAVVQRAGAGETLSKRDQNLLFWGVFVLGHGRDKRLYRPLLTLLRRPDADLDGMLDDALLEALPRLVANVFDGDAAPLQALLCDPAGEESSRMTLFGTLAFLTWDGRIPMEDTRAFLERFDGMRPLRPGDAGWHGWEATVAHLGLADLLPLVAAAHADGRLLGDMAGPEWCAEGVSRALAEDRDPARFEDDMLGYLGHPLDELGELLSDGGEDGPPTEPVRNPLRAVGRNDPCPCGSGKKHKKCCLAA